MCNTLYCDHMRAFVDLHVHKFAYSRYQIHVFCVSIVSDAFLIIITAASSFEVRLLLPGGM